MESVLFSDPFLNHISTYLNPTTLYNLCKTCKQFRIIITKSHFEKASILVIRKRLLDIYETEAKLLHWLNKLQSGGGVIAGDAILFCILDEKKSMPFECFYPSTFKFDEELIKCRSLAYDIRYHDYAECTKFYTRVIKHAVVKDSDVNRFLNNIFLFDFCRNKYWYTGKDHIDVKSFNQILSKKIKHDGHTSYFSAKQYTSMGFTFVKN